MFLRRYIFTCDWCGLEELEHFKKKEALDSYARYGYLFRLKPLNPFSDELWSRSKNHIHDYLSFCCEECAEKYFEENPEDIPHYILVKKKKHKNTNWEHT